MNSYAWDPFVIILTLIILAIAVWFIWTAYHPST